MNYPTCRTCKHFKPDVYGKQRMSFGDCSLIGEHSEGARILADGYDTLTIDDCDKFGCLLHEPLTEEKDG
jgi:hypothetical protein